MNTKTSFAVITIILGLVVTGCGVRVTGVIPTSTALPLTSTVPPTLSSAPTKPPLPPPPQPTVAPVEGSASTQVNVRAEPSTVGEILGVIPANTVLQIVGKDPGQNWWQILYPNGPDGKGWVTAQYVTATNGEVVPVIGGNSADPNGGNVAIIQQQINVRSGPGTGFNSLGTLNAQDVVSLTGKDAHGAWLQIDFAAGPEGKGWVNAAFVQAQGVENLPIITEAGQVVGTGTPTSVPATPTATVIPAWEDGDSQNAPVASVAFAVNDTHTLLYSGDISSPDGDSEDWVGFRPYGRFVAAAITCTQKDNLKVEVLENGIPLDVLLRCNEQVKQIPVKPGLNYSIHVSATQSTGALEYIGYTIIIDSIP